MRPPRFPIVLVVAFLIATTGPGSASSGEDAVHWSFDANRADGLRLDGHAESVAGVEGQAQSLNGRSLFVAEDSAGLAAKDSGFTLVLWVNAYAAGGEQQMLVGKNVYSRDQRQWGVMIDRDGAFRLYLWQDGWKTITAETRPKPGRWHQVAVVVRPEQAELWIDGRRAGAAELPHPLPQTPAPLTLGGIDDGGRIRQTLFGALDEARYFDRPLSAEALASLYRPIDRTLPAPEPPTRFPLWNTTVSLPAADELPQLENVAFYVIKKWDKPADGYTFLHGVGLAWHQGKLYASFGHNRGAENTVSEEAHYRVSEDGGKTWGPLRVIDAGDEEHLAVSHGVFLSHRGTLWAFHGAYYNKMQDIHTRAYSLDESTGQWIPHGTVVENGFWVMNQPVRMDDGNWIMPGGSFGRYANDRVFPPAVAISRGDDLTRWEFVRIPTDPAVRRMWGESALFVDGANVYNIARYGGQASALAAISEDGGRSWSRSRISNLPMATSKPAAGVLRNGQRYLVCTTAANNGGRRSPLTIAVSRPGENQFSKVFVIRRSRHDGGGESAPRLSLSYPCAVEHDGKLYVGFSNNGGRKGNLNSAELAVIPIEALAVP